MIPSIMMNEAQIVYVMNSTKPNNMFQIQAPGLKS